MLGTFAALLLCGAAQAGLEAVRIQVPPDIDGRLDDEAWTSVAFTESLFVAQRPVPDTPMSEPVRFAVAYDDQALYFAFELLDSRPGEMRRVLTPRDEDAPSEWILVMLDTFHDGANCYILGVSLAGVQYDARQSVVGGTSLSWDTIWECATSEGDSGWTAEIAIPFSGLRYPGDPEQVWGINLKRSISRTHEGGYLARMPADGDIVVEDFTDLTGLSDLPHPLGFEFRPYGAARLDSLAEGRRGRAWGDAGVDLKLRITPSLTADLAVNPDFGQIEADEAEANLSHWQTYLDEKRPFFLEGSELFDMPFSLFYSRRVGAAAWNGGIVPILGGLKLTGTAGGGLRIGVLDAYTGEVTEDGSVVEPASNYFAGRAVEELGPGSFLGLSATSVVSAAHDSLDRGHSYAGAFDFRIGLPSDLSVSGAAAGTSNPASDDGYAFRGSVGYDGDRAYAFAGANHIQEEFDANACGYTTSTGETDRWMEAGGTLNTGGTLQQLFPGAYCWYTDTPDGLIVSRGISTWISTRTTGNYRQGGGATWEGSYYDRYEGPAGRQYDGGFAWNAWMSTDTRRDVSLYAEYYEGQYCNGWKDGWWTSLDYVPLPCLSFKAVGSWARTGDAGRYNWSADGWDDRDTDWRSVELRSGLLFGPDLHVRLSSQFARFRSEWGLTGATTADQHWANLLLSWMYKPGSMFYFLVGETAPPDEESGDPGTPSFTIYSKITWFLGA